MFRPDNIHPFIRYLHKLRKERGLSQRDIWQMGGPRQTSISKMERGDWQPGLGTVTKYARALKLRIALVEDSADDVGEVVECRMCGTCLGASSDGDIGEQL